MQKTAQPSNIKKAFKIAFVAVLVATIIDLMVGFVHLPNPSEIGFYMGLFSGSTAASFGNLIWSFISALIQVTIITYVALRLPIKKPVHAGLAAVFLVFLFILILATMTVLFLIAIFGANTIGNLSAGYVLAAVAFTMLKSPSFLVAMGLMFYGVYKAKKG